MGRKAGKPDFGHPPRDYGYSIIQNLKDAGCTDELIEEFTIETLSKAMTYLMVDPSSSKCAE